MKGEKILKALEFIGKTVCETADFIDAVITPENTKGSYLGIWGGYGRERRGKHKRFYSIKAEDERLRASAYEMLYRLKRDGLIIKKKRDDCWIWKNTDKGRKKKESLKAGLYRFSPLGNYKSEQGDLVMIVSFDIPEREKRKRNWLRAILRRLGFRMMQKSVWIGKIKIPEEFINDLKKLQIISYVEIFAVTKTGTIKHIH